MLDELYQEVILDHSKSPRNFGVLDRYTCTAEGNNPMCGDQLTVYVDIKDDIISDVSYRARGCAISVASASIMSSIIKGKTIEEVNILFDKFHKSLEFYFLKEIFFSKPHLLEAVLYFSNYQLLQESI